MIHKQEFLKYKARAIAAGLTEDEAFLYAYAMAEGTEEEKSIASAILPE